MTVRLALLAALLQGWGGGVVKEGPMKGCLALTCVVVVMVAHPTWDGALMHAHDSI